MPVRVMVGMALISPKGQGITLLQGPPLAGRDQIDRAMFTGQVLPGAAGMRHPDKLSGWSQLNSGNIQAGNRLGQ